MTSLNLEDLNDRTGTDHRPSQAHRLADHKLHIPMPPVFKTVIWVVVAVVLILYLMDVFGIADIPIPTIRR